MTRTRPELGELAVGQDVMVRRSMNDMRRRSPEQRWIPARVTRVSRAVHTLRVNGINLAGDSMWRGREVELAGPLGRR